MPYRTISDLPKNVKNPLPQHAQEIYLKAFNHAWDEYKDEDEREATAHKVAWSAVKKQYKKEDDQWVARE